VRQKISLVCSWVSFLFVWFLVVGFAIRYPFPEIRDEVPENLSGMEKSLLWAGALERE